LQKYDIVVIGSGSGGIIVEKALAKDLKVAWIDKGPLGGTCLNVGCIPSKMLIYPADKIIESQEAEKLGCKIKFTDIDFTGIMNRIKQTISKNQKQIKTWIAGEKNLDFYNGEASFIRDCTLKINDKEIYGNKIFIASGSRSQIPPITSLDNSDYLTNESVFKLRQKPKTILIIGGGYIASEFSHFFATIGSDVTILQRGDRILPNEEPEISTLLKKQMTKRMKIFTDTEAIEIIPSKPHNIVIGKNRITGKKKRFKAEKIMIATGRQSNVDRLNVENTRINVDEKGYIKVNNYLETTKKNIWAFGDATGRFMFRHVANREAEVAWHNSIHKHKSLMSYHAIPHAVFTHPQIASVGLTEEEAKKKHHILVGKAYYSDAAMGWAMMEKNGFAKAIVEKNTKKILGFHIIGPNASILIQEVVNVMSSNEKVTSLINSIHIHPALSELIQSTIYSIKNL